MMAAYVFLEQTSNNWAINYYDMLGSAFMIGNTYLHYMPSADLLALPNPYDPITRGKTFFIWDSVLYNGKYYLYFGPVPALIPWIPVKWLTTVSLTDQIITLFYATLGSFSLLLLLYRVAKKMYPDAVCSAKFILIWLITALPLCFGTAIPLLLKRPMFYEAAIAGAYAYTALGIILLWYAYAESVRKPFLWKLLASLCFGLAAGCRIFHGANILILLVIWLCLFDKKSLSYSFKEALTLFTPWLAVIASIAAYNYLRFGSIFESGASYQLSYFNYTLPGSLFGDAQRFLLNLQVYLFTPISADNLIPWKPAFGRANSENIFGIFTNNIFLLWCLLIIPMLRVKIKENRFFVSLIFGVSVYGASCFILIMFYTFQSGRYMADFSPWLMLCAAVCFMHLALTQKTLKRQQIIIALGVLTSAWTVYSGFFAFSCIKCF